MRLIDCFTDALSFVQQSLAEAAAGREPSYEDLRLGVERRLAEHASEYAVGGYSRDQYLAAKFAVVAFLDERILLSEWSGRERWSRELLQRAHFNTANAGSEFFDRLDALSPFNPAERDIREVFYYCLALGFTGKFYRPGERARLDEIRQANFRLLTEGEGRVNSLRELTLFPEAYGEIEAGRARTPRRRRAALIYGVPMLALLGAFFFFRGEIISAAEYLVTVI